MKFLEKEGRAGKKVFSEAIIRQFWCGMNKVRS
jgi:hypothetical protein